MSTVEDISVAEATAMSPGSKVPNRRIERMFTSR